MINAILRSTSSLLMVRSPIQSAAKSSESLLTSKFEESNAALQRPNDNCIVRQVVGERHADSGVPASSCWTASFFENSNSFERSRNLGMPREGNRNSQNAPT